MNRFDYVAYDEIAKKEQAEFKDIFMDLESRIKLSEHNSRSASLALTKLEEAYMWIGKMIRDEQISRNGIANLEEQRSNS